MAGGTPAPLRRRSSHRGFTLIELMVAIGATVLLLSIVGVAFNHARDAMSLGVASASVNTQAKALESNLRRDIAQMSTDGFLAVRMVNLPRTNQATAITSILEADQLLFFANGAFTSALQPPAGSPPIQSISARILYGHLQTDVADTGPSIWQQPENSTDPTQWVLGRHVVLLTDGAVLSSFIPAQTPRLAGLEDARLYTQGDGAPRGLSDIANVTLADVRDGPAKYFDSSTTTFDILRVSNAMAANGFRMTARTRYRTLNRMTPREFNLLVQPVIAPNCSRFRVEIWRTGLTDRGAGGNVDVERFWRPLAPNSEAFHLAVAGYGATPDPRPNTANTIEWPKALRITVTLHDPELRYHERHLLAPNDTPDGRTYQWVFDLPQPASF